MFRDLWKPAAPRTGGTRNGSSALSSSARHQQFSKGQPFTRHSNGLEQFFNHIQGESGLNLLDLSGASQANIGFITNLGHRLYSEDLVQSLDATFGGGDFYEHQGDTEKVEAFLAQSLNFPDFNFDGALVWDVLEYLSPPLLKSVSDRLFRVLRPGAYLLAIFHADDRSEAVASYSYRISDAGTLLLTPRAMRKPAQLFNNRAVEKLFQPFEAVKFFLTRDHLREVIVKR